MGEDLGEFVAFLEQGDEESRPGRALRLAALVREFGEPRGILIPGGLVAMMTFEEARRAYLHGLDIATVVLAQTAIEHMLGGMLRQVGHDGDWGFKKILDLGLEERLISPEEFGLFDRLRVLRNPYVHAKPPFAAGTLAERSTDEDGPYILMEGDATLAISALLRLLRRHPFTPGS